MSKEKNNSLVALMNSKSDFEIAKTQNWYRIPVASAPPIVKERKLKYISFYHTKQFEQEKYSIRWYGEVNNISVQKRKQIGRAHV